MAEGGTKRYPLLTWNDSVRDWRKCRVPENADVDWNNVQNIEDDQNLIQNLGIDNIERIRKAAQIAKANVEKEVAIEQAKAENAAKVKANTEIARRNNEYEIEVAHLKVSEDMKRAKADRQSWYIWCESDEERDDRWCSTGRSRCGIISKESKGGGKQAAFPYADIIQQDSLIIFVNPPHLAASLYPKSML